jgi:hypothetical protein
VAYYNYTPLNSGKKKDVMNHDEKLLSILEIITVAFGSEIKKSTIPQATFKKAGFNFSDVQTAIGRFSGPGTFTVTSAPTDSADKTLYTFEPTKEFIDSTTDLRTRMLDIRDTQMLRIYYSRILGIFEAMLGGAVGGEDPQLNHYYTYLAIAVDEIIERDGFKELKGDMPELPESLLGSFEDLDMAWEFLQPQMRSFLGTLERRWILLKLPEFGLTESEQQLLDLTDEAIAQHRKLRDKAHQQFESSVGQGQVATSTSTPEAPPKLEKKELAIHYDKSSATLFVNDKPLKIRGAMQANLCATLLLNKNKAKEWSNDEMFATWGWSDEMILDDEFRVKKENRLKIYQKAKDLNDKIALLTKGELNDLINVTTKSVCISAPYRKNVS